MSSCERGHPLSPAADRCYACDEADPEHWRERAEAAEARIAEALAVIREAEWSSELHYGKTAWTACPSCERIDPSRTRGLPDALRVLVDHAPDCRLRAVLGNEHG